MRTHDAARAAPRRHSVAAARSLAVLVPSGARADWLRCSGSSPPRADSHPCDLHVPGGPRGRRLGALLRPGSTPGDRARGCRPGGGGGSVGGHRWVADRASNRRDHARRRHVVDEVAAPVGRHAHRRVVGGVSSRAPPATRPRTRRSCFAFTRPASSRPASWSPWMPYAPVGTASCRLRRRSPRPSHRRARRRPRATGSDRGARRPGWWVARRGRAAGVADA